MTRCRRSSKTSNAPAKRTVMRCAIYTRKSTSEGLDQAFNTLDAQRESCEAYVASQRHEGWIVLPQRYDDGGFSGGTLERPAMARLLADIDAGRLDCVVVYKVDRLSRSLLDFARIMQRFEDHDIHFVSVTQHFNTADSMGRLTLNILLSFAQFEREIISERTRDKIAAARRRGQWAGGWPILGYDLDRQRHVLEVNPQEAKQVRALFELYLRHQSLIGVAQAANDRGWRTKAWTTAKGNIIGGKPFDKMRVGALLNNVAYRGKVRHHQEVYPGLHEAIVDEATWQRVQAILERNTRTKGAVMRNRHGALLKGLLRCRACDAAMIHSAANRGPRTYRYYVCTHAQKRGRKACPTGSVNAGQIEAAVLARLGELAMDPKHLDAAGLAETAVLFGDHKCEDLSAVETALLLRQVLDAVEYDGRSGRLSLCLSDAAAGCIRASA